MKYYILGLVFLLIANGTNASVDGEINLPQSFILKLEGSDAYTKIVTDGIHPNLDGYRKIVLPELKKVLLGMQSKWLPDKSQSKSISNEADEFLNVLNGKIRLLYCQYNGSMLATKTSFSENHLKVDDVIWSCNVNATPVKDDNQAI